MLLDRFGHSNMSERKIKINFGTSKFEVLLADVLRMFWGRLESASQGHLLNVRLGRPQDNRSRGLQRVRSGRVQDSQIGSSGTCWGCLRWTSLQRPAHQFLPAGWWFRICQNYCVIELNKKSTARY